MNYDLVNELRDAGFPQGGKGSWTYPTDNLITRSRDRVYVPTLSELIEACGEEFGKLEFTKGMAQAWSAVSFNRQISNTVMLGDTPKEAVARLWLALNSKV
jgi:hypothetical protein